MTAPLAIVQGSPHPELGRIVQPDNRNRWTTTPLGALTPQTLASILKESADQGVMERFADLCDYMVESDAHLRSVYETRLKGVLSRPWEVEPGIARTPQEEQLAIAAAELCRRIVEDMPWLSRSLARMLDAVGKGWSVHEIEWLRRSGAWTPTLHWVHPRRFRFDTNWNLTLYDQGRYGFEGLKLDGRKFLVYQHEGHASYPSRTGQLRAVAWYWLFARWAWKFWVAAAERNASPPAVGIIQEGAGSTARTSLREGLQNLTDGHVAILEEKTDIKWPETKIQTTADVWDQLLARLEACQTKAMLGSTLNVDVGSSGGNRALGESQNDVTIGPRAEADAEGESYVMGEMFRLMCHFNTHLFGGVMPPVPRFVRKFDGEKPAIEPWHIQYGVADKNEARDRLGLEPRAAQLEPAPQEQVTAEPAPGGAPADVPLARQLSLPMTSPTFGRSAMNPIALALSGQLDAQASLPPAQRSKPSKRSRRSSTKSPQR